MKKQYYISIKEQYIPIEIKEKYIKDYTDDGLRIIYQFDENKFSFKKREMYDISVRGKYKQWGFPIYATKDQVEEWRNIGLTIDRVANIIPSWWVDLGFSVRLWCFFQDILNFNNPFTS